MIRSAGRIDCYNGGVPNKPVVDFKQYYLKNRTYATQLDPRLAQIIQLVRKVQPRMVLDIGCGSGFLISQLQQASELSKTKFAGVDVYAQQPRTFSYTAADITEQLPYRAGQFDCVILGEVIEHVPNTDAVLREINRVLKRGGTLVITTPNLVSWFNRLVVPFGIQPLFSEASSERKMGRRWKALGQGNKSQGHLKIFTHRSLAEILEYTGFAVTERHGTVFFFPPPLSWLDRFWSLFPATASGLIYVGRKTRKPTPAPKRL